MTNQMTNVENHMNINSIKECREFYMDSTEGFGGG